MEIISRKNEIRFMKYSTLEIMNYFIYHQTKYVLNVVEEGYLLFINRHRASLSVIFARCTLLMKVSASTIFCDGRFYPRN